MAAATHDHHDPHAEPAPLPDSTVSAAPVQRGALVAVAVGFLVYAVCGFLNSAADPEHGTRDWFMAYLCGFVFWTSLPVGSLALSMIGFLTNASWGIVFRRTFQASIRTLPVLFLLGLPVIVSLFLFEGKQSPFWWSDAAWSHPSDNEKKNVADFEDKVKALAVPTRDVTREEAEVAVVRNVRPEAARENMHKIHDFLSVKPSAALGFPIRYAVYFGLIGLFAYGVMKNARKYEANGDEPTLNRLQAVCGPGVLVWALSTAVFCTDWVMSVEPSWASSMFPVVFGMNQFLTTLAFSAFLFYSLTKGKADVMAIVKEKFRIDIGSLMFGFTMLWAYSSFCQYMLIWAGNLPEEIPYYLKRGAGEPNADGTYNGWLYLSYTLMLFHWLVPFIVLLFREVKTNPQAMRFMTVLLMTVCALDVVWWIMPSVPRPARSFAHVPMALGAILGVGGLWGLAFARELGKHPILVGGHQGRFLADWGHH